MVRDTAFTCTTPFVDALSSARTAVASAVLAAALSFAVIAVRTRFTRVRTELRTERFCCVFLMRWRLRFSAEGWLATTVPSDKGLSPHPARDAGIYGDFPRCQAGGTCGHGLRPLPGRQGRRAVGTVPHRQVRRRRRYRLRRRFRRRFRF